MPVRSQLYVTHTHTKQTNKQTNKGGDYVLGGSSEVNKGTWPCHMFGYNRGEESRQIKQQRCLKWRNAIHETEAATAGILADEMPSAMQNLARDPWIVLSYFDCACIPLETEGLFFPSRPLRYIICLKDRRKDDEKSRWNSILPRHAKTRLLWAAVGGFHCTWQ